MGEAYGREVFDELGTAADVEVGVGGRSEGPDHGSEPVDIGIAELVDAAGRLAELLQVGARGEGAELLVVHLAHVHQGHRVVCVHVHGRVDGVGKTLGEGDLHVGLPFGTAPGGDDDDAVRTLGTEHGRRGGVLQDGDVGDLIGIEAREVTLHAVDEYQGAVVVETGDTADDDLGVVLTRLAGDLQGGDAGELTGQCVGDVGYTRLHEDGTLDLGDGADDALLALGTVTHDHDIFQRLGGLAQDEPVLLLAGDGDDERLVADECNLEMTRIRNRQGECAVEVGDGALRAPSLHDDVCSDDGLAAGVHDHALDGAVGCRSRGGCAERGAYRKGGRGDGLKS